MISATPRNSAAGPKWANRRQLRHWRVNLVQTPAQVFNDPFSRQPEKDIPALCFIPGNGRQNFRFRTGPALIRQKIEYPFGRVKVIRARSGVSFVRCPPGGDSFRRCLFF